MFLLFLYLFNLILFSFLILELKLWIAIFILFIFPILFFFLKKQFKLLKLSLIILFSFLLGSFHGFISTGENYEPFFNRAVQASGYIGSMPVYKNGDLQVIFHIKNIDGLLLKNDLAIRLYIKTNTVPKQLDFGQWYQGKLRIKPYQKSPQKKTLSIKKHQ